MKLKKRHRSFKGEVSFCSHDSRETRTEMSFSTFRPAGQIRGCLIWLSGLTCTDENFMAKAFAQPSLQEHGLMVICPDTSPRGLQLPDEHSSWDFGSGAGFYVDAKTPGYKDHYRMYSYVTRELHPLIQKEFGISPQRISIMGHSMGGHGALVMGLREPGLFQSVSAFSPIVNPVQSPWGQKAFTGYLGEDRNLWPEYDATELLRNGRRHPRPLLIDQGTADEFLSLQLLTPKLASECLAVPFAPSLQKPVETRQASPQRATVRMQDGYDHSYYFISTFIRDHVEFHSSFLV